jgi:hypothetical protein
MDEQDWAKKATEMLGSLPANFEERAKALSAANHGFRHALRNQLEPALNAHLQAVSQESNESKKQSIDSVRDQLTELGLAVRCPVTGEPGNLYAIAPSKKSPSVQFWIKPKNRTSPTVCRVDLNALLPVELVDASPRVEGFAKWRRHLKGRENDDPETAR